MPKRDKPGTENHGNVDQGCMVYDDHASIVADEVGIASF